LSIAQQPAAEPQSRARRTPIPSPFNPQLGALMNMVIQPRHTKLGLAGKAENWPLASYYFQGAQARFLGGAKGGPALIIAKARCRRAPAELPNGADARFHHVRFFPATFPALRLSR